MAIGKALGQMFQGSGDQVIVEDFVVSRLIEAASGGSDKEFESKTYTFQRQESSTEASST
jgi:hypothetical protein